MKSLFWPYTPKAGFFAVGWANAIGYFLLPAKKEPAFAMGQHRRLFMLVV